MDALQLTALTVLTTEQIANFAKLVHPILMNLPEEKSTTVLAQILEVIGRAVAGDEIPPRVGNVTVVAGDVFYPDTAEKIG